MIEVRNLYKSYKNGDVCTKVLKDMNLTVEDGAFVTIMGRSGCGKSTLLNILGGMDRADQGTYLFDGTPVSGMDGRSLACFRNQKVGFVFQSFHLLPEFNVADNVALPLGYGGMGAKQRRKISMELLEKVGLADKARRRPSQLSGGEQQRVAIARAVAAGPKVLLADEPTGSLDEENGQKIMEMLKALNTQGLTILLVTHDPKVAACGSRMIHMADGRIVTDDINNG